MLNKLILITNTLYYLKKKQIFFQLWYRLKSFFYKNKKYSNEFVSYKKLIWKDVVNNANSYNGNNSFTFLNIKYDFINQINWQLNKYGKLWTYNLNYFDYLNQKNLDKKNALILINSFIKNYDNIKVGKEPYPTSLRIINWIKFISKNKIYNISILKIIREDSNRLLNNLEYHLLANHLLENAFALFFSSFLFNDSKYFKISEKILKEELNEQILNDGAHFELSPMYHQIILYRLLDCINLYNQNNIIISNPIISFFNFKASLMISWLKEITFNNGQIPLVNDSANNIAPNSKELLYYCNYLNIFPNSLILSSSGYRMIKRYDYEIIIDIGNIGPKYQSGHAHADTFNFLLNIKDHPVFIDTSISTYNISKNREIERSTFSHNTVTVKKLNTSEVWSSFRVANRANVLINEDNEDKIIASHDGYNSIKTKHQREWNFKKNIIEIIDDLTGKFTKGTANFFISEKIIPRLINNNVVFFKKNNLNFQIAELNFTNPISVKIINVRIPSGFNKFKSSHKIEVYFDKKLKTKISL